MKQCSICGQFKDLSQFARRSDSLSDGYLVHCLECQAEKNRRHYAANREKIKARTLERRAKIKACTYNPEESKQYSRQKHRIDLPPQKPVAQALVIVHLDDNEYQFLEQEADKRSIRMEEILREMVRAAWAASLQRAQKEEKKDGNVRHVE